MTHLNLVANTLLSHGFPANITTNGSAIVVRFAKRSIDATEVSIVLDDMIEDRLVNVRRGVAGSVVVTINE